MMKVMKLHERSVSLYEWFDLGYEQDIFFVIMRTQ